MMIPDTAFAVATAVLWAISARIVGRGMAAIPGPQKFPAIAAGLMVSLLTGSAVLYAVAGRDLVVSELSPWLIAAGVATFPVGTALYYLCGHAFAGRMEFASQFANVKPLFSVGFAVLVLGETLRLPSWIALALIAAGIAVLLRATRRGAFSWAALGLGVLLALAWAAGEGFAKLGLATGPSLTATLAALLSGAAVGAVLALPYLAAHRRLAFTGFRRWGWAFALHGLLSFVVAYACLFESIQRIGVGRTILINAFWPGLAVVFGWIEGRLTGRAQPVPGPMTLATVLLVSGSVVQIGGLFLLR